MSRLNGKIILISGGARDVDLTGADYADDCFAQSRRA